MRKYYPILLLLIVLLACNNNDETQPEMEEPENCRILSYSTDFDQTLRYEYNEVGLVSVVNYEIASNTGRLLLTWDNQERLIGLSSSNTNISITYGVNETIANNQYTPSQTSSVTIPGSGEVTFNLNQDNLVTSVYRGDTQLNRMEYNSDGLTEKVYFGTPDQETLWAEIPSYDDKVNPFQKLPINHFVSFPNGNREVFWQFEPWNVNRHNPERIIIHTTIGVHESITNYQYNEFGYPISNSGTVNSTFTYICE